MAKLRQIEIDFEHVENVTGNDPEFMFEILEMIVDQTPGVMAELRTLCDSQAYPELGGAAHKYKSSVNILGNKEIDRLLKDLENEAIGLANEMELDTMVRDLEAVCAGMMAQLQGKLQELGF